jgi:acyl carrier protein
MELDVFVIKLASQFEESDVKNVTAMAEFKYLETWDSLTSMSVQEMIKDEFNLDISSDDLNQTDTVLDLFNFILSLKH